MDWIEKIRNVVDRQFFYDKDSGINIVLEETGELAECKEVRLKKGVYKTLTLALDKRKILKATPNPQEKDVTTDIHPLLQDGIKDLKKQCDYVVFCQKETTLYAFLIEMKSKNSDTWIQQTYAGEHIVRYLLGMVENYEGLKLLDKVQFRHLLFSMTNADNMQGRKKKKTTTTPFEYTQHPKFELLYVRKPCNTDYELGIFLR